MQAPGWSQRVAADYHARLRQGDGPIISPLGKLSELKASIRLVSQRMLKEQRVRNPADSPPTDDLGTVMGAIRRLERLRWLWAPTFLARSPCLKDVLLQSEIDRDPSAVLARLRPLAVDLARKSLRQDLEQLNSDLPSLDSEQAKRRRGDILRKLRRIVPGRAPQLTALRDDNGDVQVGPREVAGILRRHWGAVFAARRLAHRDVEAWIEEDTRSPSGLAAALQGLVQDPSRWCIRRADIAKAIERTARSAPGPDGIPYLAWRNLGSLAVDVLFQVAQVLEGTQGLAALEEFFPLNDDMRSDFNAAVMVFIPKGQPLRSESGTSYTLAGDLRPLSIVNTDNRLLASALRFRIEPLLEQALSDMQQGFLPGRSLLRNVVDIDARMREVALLCDHPAGIFFDFQAAFPSLSHTFLMKSLAGLGLPPTVCRFVECLYWGHGCTLASAGGVQPGFCISAGIRQGCPISPLLFAVIMDPLLRRLQRQLPTGTFRAYADDLAAVLEDLPRALPTLIKLFQDFAKASGLQLNFRKVVVVPLGDVPVEEVSRTLLRPSPGWSAVECRGWAKYLGFVLGPTRAERTWDQACSKALQRAKLWNSVGLGLLWSMLAYRIYIASVLGFLLQLDTLPSHWASTEAALLRAIVPGPYRWCEATDLQGLRRDLGFAQEFPDLRMTSIAARVRVHCREAAAHGGLRVREWLRRLESAHSRSQHLGREGCWRAWFASSFCHSLHLAFREMRNAGVALPEVHLRAAQATARPLTELQEQRSRKRTQRAAEELIREREVRHPEARMRKKLEHWPMELFPRLRGQRAVAVLRRLAALAPPRVCAAVLRTWWSGWCTARRFGSRGTCRFGCADAADSVEHASVCRLLAQFGRDHLCLQYHAVPGPRRLQFLLLEHASVLDDRNLLFGALRIAAAYRVHCTLRRRAMGRIDQPFIFQALQQATKEAVRGHAAATAAYDSRWAIGRCAATSVDN